MNNWGFASFFSRLSLGIFVGMIGVQKVFVIGASNHAQNFFINGFKDHWIPEWLLLLLGYSIPYVELICGVLIFIGFWVRLNTIIIGFLLLIVAYGHMLQDAFYDPTSHWLPRFMLMIAVLLLYNSQDKWSLEHLIRKQKSS